ncbi:MAG: GGDEF domain-containing protein [Candidatus Eisenbacteria bacterium]
MKRQAVTFHHLLERILPLAALPAADRQRAERALAHGSPAEQETVALTTVERLVDQGSLVRLPDRLEGGDRVARWRKKDGHEIVALRFEGPLLPTGLAAYPRLLLTLRAHAPSEAVHRLRRLDDALLREDGRLPAGHAELIGLLFQVAREVLDCDGAAFFPGPVAGDYAPPAGETPLLAPWLAETVVARDRLLVCDDLSVIAAVRDTAARLATRSAAAVRVEVVTDDGGEPVRGANGGGFGGVLEVRSARAGYFTSERLSLLSLLAESFCARARQAARLERLVFVDSLTGAYNNAYFRQALDNEVARARRDKESLALVIADIDDFKSFNTTYGYEGGNAVLIQVARALRRTVRPFDSVARWGGEEFAVLLTSPLARVDAETIAERLRLGVQEAETTIEGLDGQQHRARITVSLGAALFPDDADSAEALWRVANLALLEAKRPPKNRVLFAPPGPAPPGPASPDPLA